MSRNTISKLKLLLWKNLIIRKRQYIVTALEIVLPTLFAVFVAFLKAQLGNSGKNDGPVAEQYFPRISEEELVLTTVSTLVGFEDAIIGFSPNAPEVKNFLIEDVEPFLKNISNGNLTTVKWIGYSTEMEMEAAVAEQDFNFDAERLRLAFVIHGLEKSNQYPKNHKVSYKIRLVEKYFDDTKEVMPLFTLGAGDCEYVQDIYRFSGFAGWQILLDKLLIARMTGIAPQYTVSIGAFPCPKHESFDFSQLYFILLPQLMVFGFVFVVPSIVRGIVSEKETGIKELMKMNGLSNWMHLAGWMLNSLVVLVISITIVVVVYFVPMSSDSGGVLQNSDPTLWWFVLVVYAMWATSYCFLIASFFESPTLATTTGIVLWLVSYFGVSIPLESKYKGFSLTSKMLLCLCPNLGLHYALKILCAFEAKKGVGAQWKYLGRPASTIDPLALWHVILMLGIATAAYTLLAMYIEDVLPSKYGIKKPWYYPFQMFSSKSGEPVADIQALRTQKLKLEDSFEVEPTDLPVGLEVLKLRKEFGQKVSVQDISMKAFVGQIFCLLGHNGAGKTTTMSVLTGLFGPTSGTALINGKDIRTEMDSIREELGLCPQFDLLFTKLTVAEHLRFFGRVKGLNEEEVKIEVPRLISKLKLEEKSNVLAMALSGGMKRRLSLGCAVIGNSKMIFLDECSSGLDPEARRAIWDLLLELREGRTIILTTHFLEEADVLGDRIAIMASGRIQCCGTPMFLKKYYGAGYTINVSTVGRMNSAAVVKTVRDHIPSAYLKSEVPKGGAIETKIVLGTQGSTVTFPTLFADLLGQKALLGIIDLGISLTTMEDVFLKVEDHEQQDHESPKFYSKVSPEQENKLSGILLLAQQFSGIFRKKVCYSMRKRKLLLCQTMLPVLLLVAAIMIVNSNYESGDDSPALAMSLSDYKEQIVLYATEDVSEAEGLGKCYANFVGSPAKQLPSGSNVSVELMTISYKDEDSYFQRHAVAADIDGTDVYALYSNVPPHSCSLSISLATNAILRCIRPEKEYSLETINHPITSKMEQMFDAASMDPVFTEVAPYIIGLLVSIGLALLSASYVVMPVEERNCNAKQLQQMTGVNPIIYWGAAFCWDYLVTFVCVIVMVACLFIFQKYEGFTNNGGAGVAFAIMAVYGMGSVTFSHFLSLATHTPAGGFTLIAITHILTGAILPMGSYILESIPMVEEAKKVALIGRFFPTYGASKSLMIYARAATKNGRCNALTDESKAILCKPNEYYKEAGYQACCANCVELGADCVEIEKYMIWENSEGLPGITQELFFMAVMSSVYFLLLMIVEFGFVKWIIGLLKRTGKMEFTIRTADDDVHAEAYRVDKMIQKRSMMDDALVVDYLCKNYGKFAAVSKLAFGVHAGECFGLLGVNGAGKTTTFKMLTGDESAAIGDAWIDKSSLKSNKKEFLKCIGYCPQFDGIIGVLTGEEMLGLFARLRGVRESEVPLLVNTWLDRFGLLSSATVQCQNYSGGMKRRLSAAMAVIGDPPIILLDEPTSGVDPVSRRQFWGIIASLRDAGRSIILTSHSMDECENLCTRLGIMVNGELQCLGRVQHLKNKFAQGYALTVRSTPTASHSEEYVTSLIHQVTTRLHPCSVKDQHQAVISFHIESNAIELDRIFEIMESIKFQLSGCIEDYVVQQTTLEEVFLSFARKQYNYERKVEGSKIKQFISSLKG